MFQEALQFKDVIIFCYSRQNTIRISGRVSYLLIQHISQKIMNILSYVVSVYVLNQFNNHSLLLNAL
jgi:adenylate cyclase